MNKICTSIEQSKKLVELGIDVNTADMFYADMCCFDGNHKYNLHPLETYGFKTFSETKLKTSARLSFIPAWSLSALLELMPKDESKTIDLCLGGSNGMEHTFDWFCTCDENDEPFGYKTFHTSSPIDCTFEMVCWLLENKKL